MSKRTITIKIDEGTYEKINCTAKSRGLTLSEYIKFWLTIEHDPGQLKEIMAEIFDTRHSMNQYLNGFNCIIQEIKRDKEILEDYLANFEEFVQKNRSMIKSGYRKTRSNGHTQLNGIFEHKKGTSENYIG